MLAKLRARAQQGRRELGYIWRAVESLTSNLHHLSRQPGSIMGRGGAVVLIDRRSLKHALCLGMSVRALPRVEVKVVRTHGEVAQLLEGYARRPGEPTRLIVSSRLVYAKYYPLFAAFRAAARVIVL